MVKALAVFFAAIQLLFSVVFGMKELDTSKICFIGHRGYSSRYLENTSEAFIKAAEHGSGGVETDVRITKDGVLVLSHNSEVKFADGTELLVADHTYEELTAKPLKNRFTRTKLYLCTFKEYLEICKQYGMFCFIEFKGEFPREKITEAFNLAAEVYDLSQCELQSFEFENLIAAHEEFPDLQIMLTCDEHDELVDRCLEYGFDIDMEFHGLKPETVKQFHDKGLKVAVWTANTAVDVIYCAGLDVDFIESDVYSKVPIIH